MARHTPKSVQETLEIAKAELDQVRNKMSEINAISHDMEATIHNKMSEKFNALSQDIETAIREVEEDSAPDKIDTNLRIKGIHEWHTDRSEQDLCVTECLALIFQYFLSPFAVVSLWSKQGALDYVLEVEKRRKKDLPAETFNEYRKRTRSQRMKYPLFVCTIILITVAHFVLDLGIETTIWSQHLQLVKKHPTCMHLLGSMNVLSLSGLCLERRHGSPIVAGVSLVATCAAVALGFSFDPTNGIYMSITLSHVLLGMNWADMWISWSMFIEIPALSHFKVLGKVGKDWTEEHKKELYHQQLLHMGSVGVVEILPLILEMIARPEWLGNAFCNVFGFFFGFFFMLPFLSNMANLPVFGDQPEWRDHFSHRCGLMWLKFVCLWINPVFILYLLPYLWQLMDFHNPS